MANGRERERATTEVGGAWPGFDVMDLAASAKTVVCLGLCL